MKIAKMTHVAVLLCAVLNSNPAIARRAGRPTPPTRDPNTPGYVTAKELPDGTNAAGGCRRKFYHRPDSQPRAGNDCADQRAARNGV